MCKTGKPVLFIVLTDSFFVITVLGRNVLPCRKWCFDIRTVLLIECGEYVYNWSNKDVVYKMPQKIFKNSNSDIFIYIFVQAKLSTSSS